jgi:hypothetical protein
LASFREQHEREKLERHPRRLVGIDEIRMIDYVESITDHIIVADSQ